MYTLQSTVKKKFGNIQNELTFLNGRRSIFGTKKINCTKKLIRNFTKIQSSKTSTTKKTLHKIEVVQEKDSPKKNIFTNYI